MSVRGILLLFGIIITTGLFFGPNLELLIRCVDYVDISLFEHKPFTAMVLVIGVSGAVVYGCYHRHKSISLADYVKKLEYKIDPKRSSSDINKDGSVPS